MAFEFFETNDANQVARKIAGEYVTQGADDLFHQTAVAVPKRLSEGNIATLDAVGTTITLTGFETHAIFDLNAVASQRVHIALRYFTGGRLYPADIQFGSPHYLQQGGIDAAVNEGYAAVPQDFQAFSDGTDGSSLLFVPTRGAVELFIETASGSILDVDYALVVMPTTHPLSTTVVVKRRGQNATASISATAQPYVDGDIIGGRVAANIDDNNVLASDTDLLRGAPILKTLSFVSGWRTGVNETWDVRDVDIYLFKHDEGPTFVSDGNEWVINLTPSNFDDCLGFLQFRENPGDGQYRTHNSGGGWYGQARNLNIPLLKMLPDTGAFGKSTGFDAYIVYKGANTVAVNAAGSTSGPRRVYSYELS